MRVLPRVMIVMALFGIAVCLRPTRGEAAVARAPVSFHLQISGLPAPNMTFWVAYGPLAGRFGLVQLRPVGQGLYVGTRVLPIAQRTEFAYLAGYGLIHTRAGPAPDDPVITIHRFGPVAAQRLPVRVQWDAPVG